VPLVSVSMPEQTFLEAIRCALAEEMRRDASVYLFGEDVALGGPFGATKGLADEFGTNRIVNTPISEGTVMGLSTGAAIAGLRPVVEIMFIDFITLAMDQLVNHAAKLHYMSGGQLRIPLTIRVQCGITGAMGAHHSQSLEAWLTHVPGLKVLMPATPADAKGLLKAAIREDNPVVFIEHRGLYWTKGEIPEKDDVVPIGKAKVLRQGDQITIVALASMVGAALGAADELAEQGISVEVVDLRSVSPLDIETIIRSTKKTSRVIVVHEAVRQSGIGAEIAALVQEHAFYHLDCPVLRIAAPFAPIPAGKSLESAFLPGKDLILEAARRSIAFR
jgi:pyruvate/2-oxoglutarate/acetoin dehydrogenase E1 component